ncbi:unnamed protein product, partial [Ixodes pacificus]
GGLQEYHSEEREGRNYGNSCSTLDRHEEAIGQKMIEREASSWCGRAVACLLVTVLLLVIIIWIVVIIAGGSANPFKHMWPFKRELTIKTSLGEVRGALLQVLNKTIRVFYGIPFATAPNRFATAVPHSPWRGVRDAQNPLPNRCPQPAHTHYFDVPVNSSTQEDCLFIDIYAPDSTPDAPRRPVVLILHGGAFQTGSNRDPLYDGKFLAAVGEVIVAVPNYRLNAFGFFQTSLDTSPGNQGLWDQHLAIKWVHTNAPVFGGRRGLVTLLGVDSGAISAGLHLLSPASRELFSRVIMQGGSPFYMGEFAPYVDDAELDTFAKSVCSNISREGPEDEKYTLECLRNASVSELLDNLDPFDGVNKKSFGPYYGEKGEGRLTRQLQHAIHNRPANVMRGKDLLIGYTFNEGEYFMRLLSGAWSVSSVDRFPRALVRIFLERLCLQFYSRPKLLPLLEFYFGRKNASSNMDCFLEACDFLGDVYVKCPVGMMADHVSASGGRVYVYELDLETESVAPAAGFSRGAPHYADALLSLGHVYHRHSTTPSTALNLSAELMGRWAAFASTGYEASAPIRGFCLSLFCKERNLGE